MKIAAAYIRCSTDMQEDSPEQQKQEIQKFADQHGYSIAHWFVDFGWSGTTFDMRPEFLKLKRCVETGSDFQYVICYDESRWGRAINPEENTYWRVHFEKHGVKVILVKTSIDPDHEFAPMMKAFEGIQASQYSKKLSELTLRGAKANGIYSNGGTAPYGYQRQAVNLKTGAVRPLSAGEWSIPSQEKVSWTVGASSEVETVRFIFEERSRGKAYILIAEDLNNRGIPCPQRGRWRNRDQKWSTVTIKTIIENPAYYGARIYNRNSMSKIQAKQRGKELRQGVMYPHWHNDQSEWIAIEDAHPPIVSRAVWECANSYKRTASSPDRSSTLTNPINGHILRSPYLLSGLIRCSKCGFNFQGWSGTTDGKRYYKYIDGGWQNKRVCKFLGIPKSQLEGFTLAAVKEVLNDAETMRDIEKQLQTLLESSSTGKNQEIRTLHTKILEVDKKISRYLSLFEQGPSGKGTVSESILDRLQELESEKKIHQQALSRLQSVEDEKHLNVGTVSTTIRQFFQNFQEEFARLPIVGKKQLIRKIVPEIIIDRDREVAEVHIRKLPAVTKQMEDLYSANKKALTALQIPQPVSAMSSGGRT